MKTRLFIPTIVLAATGCFGGGSMPGATNNPTTPGMGGDMSNPATPGADTVTGSIDPSATTPDWTSSANPKDTFDHPNAVDPAILLQRIADEGPPEVSTRMHGCAKLHYAALGTTLASFGVNLNGRNNNLPPAGQLYKDGNQALGAPNYTARTPETTDLTTAGATKLFDVYVQAASEIIRAMPTIKRCQRNGQGTQMFDAQGKCTIDGISCLQGTPATAAQQAICNQAIMDASTPQIGQQIAVASLLAAANTCE